MKRFHKSRLLFIVIALLLLSTSQVAASPSKAPAGPPPLPPASPAPDTSLAVHALTYAPGALDNPLKGFLPFYDPANDYASVYPHSMEWAYIALSEIMTDGSNCTAYNWTVVDQILNGIASHGNQAAIRVYLQYPSGGTGTHPQDGTPACLNGKVAMRWDSFWSINTPDYDDPDMIQALKGFINAEAARYDGDARLGAIHMGLIGLWGEWHTWPYDSDTSDGYPNYFPTNTTVNTIIDTYTAAFHKTKLVIRYPDLGGGHASQAPIGFADDSWGFNEGSPLQSITLPQSMGGASYAFLQLALNVGGENQWINQIIGGEARPEIQQVMFPQYWPNGGGNVSNLLDSVELTHISWMMNQQGINSYSSSDAKVAEAIRKIGYELFVKNSYFNASAPSGGQFKVGVQIENRGVAHFYYPWKMIIGLKNSAGTVVKTWDTTWDITKVQPLQIRKFPDWNTGTGYMAFGSPYYYDTTLSAAGVANGTYTVVVRVQNPLESINGNAKKLRFANQTQNTDGWLGLGSITFAATVPTNTPAPATATRTNTPIATATPSSGTISYEAEATGNTLAGGAVVASCTGCSGGQAVGYVGNNAGTLQFNGVNASSAGSRSLIIYYTNGDTAARTAQMSINGGTATTLSFPVTGGWATVGSITATINLNAGSNTIKFSNNTAGSWAPDFDRITVNGGTAPTATATRAASATPTTSSSTSYEAESAGNTLAGGAVVSACTGCSGGQKVGYVGNNAGTLQFNGVSASSAGTRSLTIYYTNGTTARSSQISVNGGTATTVSFPSTANWDTVGSVTITITLNAGSNTIKFFNSAVGSWSPDFDRIVIN